MATRPRSTVLDNLRRTLLCQDEAGLTDAELLACFVTQHDERAFAALLRRHGPMVLGVCRRVLRNEADAEDAFQATFLVLVRKAASIRPAGMVGNWLHGVAHNTALKAKAMNTRRRAKEREAAARPTPEAPAEDWERLEALLDQELRALPDRYRAPIVLCDLEGKSIKEAARQFGLPPGTVGTRLARGRRLLARRLVRQGLTLSGGVLATLLSPGVLPASVPLSLADATVKAATLSAAGPAAAGVISTQVAALTEGVVKAMLVTKLKTLAAVLLAVTLLASGGVLLALRVLRGEQSHAAQGDAKADQAKILGTWTVVAGFDGGNKVENPKGKLVITKDKLTVYKDANQIEVEGTYVLDPTRTPKWIDLTIRRGGEERTMLGIYELDGDNLKICLNERSGADGQRSTEFVSRPNSPNDLLVVLKRERP